MYKYGANRGGKRFEDNTSCDANGKTGDDGHDMS